MYEGILGWLLVNKILVLMMIIMYCMIPVISKIVVPRRSTDGRILKTRYKVSDVVKVIISFTCIFMI